MDNEIWKDIKGFEGLYQISNFGRVKSVDRVIPHSTHGEWHIKERILKPSKNGYGHGYYYVILFDKNKITHNKQIHRLVAEHFLNRIHGKNVVNHKDCNKENNSLDNLEWCTDLENTKHAWEHGRCENLRDKSYIEKKCRCIETGEIFNSVKDAGEKVNRPATNISRACKLKYPKVNGYHFEYV